MTPLAPAFAMGLALAGAAAPCAATPPPTGEWAFRALLDGTPIGQHRFSVRGEGDERRVTSQADFTVKVLGLTAYRYRHQATERWRGNCLTALESTTDDDGRPAAVRVDESDALRGCVMSFAYWNPAIQSQTRLLNAHTGQFETVQVRRAGTGSVEVRGRAVEANEFRITGAAQPIVVWYTPGGEWIGLDSIVAGGRKLTYRLP